MTASDMSDDCAMDGLLVSYAERWQSRMIRPAKVLLDIPDGELAALALVLMYFEQHAIFVRGEDSKDTSREFFVEGFIHVFNRAVTIDKTPAGWDITETTATRWEVSAREAPPIFHHTGEILYRQARCGLFHDGLEREGIHLKTLQQNRCLEVGRAPGGGASDHVFIDPRNFVEAVSTKLREFMLYLRDERNVTAREKSLRAWRLKYPSSAIPPGAAPPTGG